MTIYCIASIIWLCILYFTQEW